MERMNMFTLLAGPGGGCRDGPARRRGDEAGRRQHLVGVHDPGGVRLLFGVGEGPAEAVAGAKQGRVGNADRLRRGGRRLAWESRSAEVAPVSLESASFLRQSPVVNHLSFTCRSTC